MKQDEGKIDTCFMGDFVVAVAGAGTTDYIQTAVDAITRRGLEFTSLLQLEIVLRDKLLEFFDRHLLRWSNFHESERPMVELLIAVTGKRKRQYHGLFHYAGTSFHQVHEKAIGAGMLLANSLISEHVHGPQTLNELRSLIVYILCKVKKQVDTCGGYTDLVILERGGHVAFTNSAEIGQLEHIYEALEKETSDKLRASIVEQKLPDLMWLNK